MKKYVSAYPTLMKEGHREKMLGQRPRLLVTETKKYGGFALMVMLISQSSKTESMVARVQNALINPLIMR